MTLLATTSMIFLAICLVLLSAELSAMHGASDQVSYLYGVQVGDSSLYFQVTESLLVGFFF